METIVFQVKIQSKIQVKIQLIFCFFERFPFFAISFLKVVQLMHIVYVQGPSSPDLKAISNLCGYPAQT
jgi:hypothetical protein